LRNLWEKGNSSITAQLLVMDDLNGFVMVAPVDDGASLALAITSERLKTDLIKAGQYVAKGDTVNASPELLTYWMQTFHTMKKNGVDVPLLKHHSFDDEPELVIGYMDEMFLDKDGWLSGIATLRGDGVELAQKVNKVSIGVKTYKDGLGRVYKNAIQHVALTAYPVVPDQRGFQALEKRNTGTAFSIYSFKVDSKETKNTMNQKQIETIAEALGEDVTKENVIDKIVALSAEVKDLRAAKAKVAELELTAIPRNDPNINEQWGKIYEARIERCVTETKITPEFASQFKLSLLGSKGSRNELALSTTSARPTSFAETMVSLIEGLPARVEMGVKTGVQVGVLDDKGRSGKQKLDALTVERFALAGGATPEQAKSAANLVGAL
jgi:hypothetical protein